MLPSRFLFLRGLIAGKFKLRGLLGLFGLMLILSIGLGSVAPLWSQTPLPSPKEACAVPLALCADIKSLAQEDVVDDIPRRTAHAIDLFKEKHPDWQNDPNKAKREVSRMYDREYSQREKTKKQDLPSIWKKLTENGFLAPFLGLVLLALAGWFKDGIGKGWTALTKKIDDWVYGRFAGTPFFESLALKRYREALVENYQELKIPFRVNHKPLDMSKIYVPLKVAGSSDSEQVDAYGSIAKYRRLVIKGIPGSGKTMLLRHVAFAYGKGELMGLENRPVPVLLELHRLSDADLTEDKLIGAIVEAFKLNRFPKAERFVRHSLEQGKLMLLLDGLDEVNSKVRLAVAQKISDLLQSLDKKQGCRLIVTCRTAVYSNEFAGKTDQMLEVVEFTDQQMRRFLDAWKTEIPVGKSIDQLIQTLRDRPRIMSLARNPLLLTIIVHLYTDPAFELPRSRAEFYQESTRILLDQWQDQFNKYRGVDKRRVLQHLALYQQKNSPEKLQNRRSIDYAMVLEQIGVLLPSLNLDPKNDSIPLLNELVERSGLFLRIDGGDQYQFAHLTLQEYFAAVALNDKPDDLKLLFEQDHMNWREVVKLWCGLTGDSTFLISDIFKMDKLLAFECLADAQEVDQQKADEIVDYFQGLLGNYGYQEDIVKVFGAVAASDRPRGQKVFRFLQDTLGNPKDSYRYESIAQALSFTNQPKAAKSLSKFYDLVGMGDIVRQPMIRMGDLAVPELIVLANQKNKLAIHDLYLVGTTNAAQALVPMLWKHPIACWYLAALLSNTDVEQMLRNYSVEKLKGSSTRFLWAWQPFQDASSPALSIIISKILETLEFGFNLRGSHGVVNPSRNYGGKCLEIDSRIAIFLFIYTFKENKKDFNHFQMKKIQQFQIFANQQEYKDEIDKEHQYILNLNTVNSIINELQGKKAWWYLLINLNPVLQLDLLNTMITANRFPTDRDWLNIFQVTHYQFKTGWHYQISLMFSAILSLLAVIGIWEVALTQKEAALIMLNGLIVAVITTFWLVMAYESWEPNLFINSGVFGVKLYYNELSQFLKNSSASYFVNIITKLYRFKGHQKGANSFMTALVLALSGILWIVLFVYSFKPLEMNVFVAAASILVLLINIIHLISDKQNDISYSFVLILFTIAITVNSGNIISAVEIWIVSALSILGIACWYSIDNKIEKPWVKPCAVFALPWFCTAPFVLVFAGVELTFLLTPTNFLPTSPWQTAGLIELFFVGLIILVWQRGQKLDRMARNPLQGGLIEKMLREKYYRSNV